MRSLLQKWVVKVCDIQISIRKVTDTDVTAREFPKGKIIPDRKCGLV